MALKQKIYETPAEKKKDFWLGVGLFFGLNILMGLCSGGAVILFANASNSLPSSVIGFSRVLFLLLNFLPWIVNFGLLFYLALTRSQIALGMLAGFGIALAITILLGVIFSIWCLISLSSGSF